MCPSNSAHVKRVLIPQANYKRSFERAHQSVRSSHTWHVDLEEASKRKKFSSMITNREILRPLCLRVGSFTFSELISIFWACCFYNYFVRCLTPNIYSPWAIKRFILIRINSFSGYTTLTRVIYISCRKTEVSINICMQIFLTYQCLQDWFIPVFTHCRQNRSHIAAHVGQALLLPG